MKNKRRCFFSSLPAGLCCASSFMQGLILLVSEKLTKHHLPTKHLLPACPLRLSFCLFLSTPQPSFSLFSLPEFFSSLLPNLPLLSNIPPSVSLNLPVAPLFSQIALPPQPLLLLFSDSFHIPLLPDTSDKNPLPTLRSRRHITLQAHVFCLSLFRQKSQLESPI